MTAFAAKLLTLETYARHREAQSLEGNPYLDPIWLFSLNGLTPSSVTRTQVFVMSSNGKTVLVLALMIQSRWGVRVCECFDTGFNNNNTPLFDSCVQTQISDSLFKTLKQALPDIDLFHFSKQQIDSGEGKNPLFGFCDRVKHPNCSYFADLGDCFEGFERAHRSRASLRGLRKKTRRLEHANGAVTLKKMSHQKDINACLEVFFSQRAQSERLGRVPNPFANKAVQSALKDAAFKSAGQTNGLKVFALSAGATTVAVSLILVRGRYQSGFAHSFDPDFSQFSPGRLLEWQLLRFQQARGVRQVDFGLGDDGYKAEWSDLIWLYDAFLAMNLKGRMLQIALTTRLFLHRTFKMYGGTRVVKKIKLLAARVQQQRGGGLG